WHEERLSPTRLARSVALIRPSSWSSERISRLNASTPVIVPQQPAIPQEKRRTFHLFRRNIYGCWERSQGKKKLHGYVAGPPVLGGGAAAGAHTGSGLGVRHRRWAAGTLGGPVGTGHGVRLCGGGLHHRRWSGRLGHPVPNVAHCADHRRFGLLDLFGR